MYHMEPSGTEWLERVDHGNPRHGPRPESGRPSPLGGQAGAVSLHDRAVLRPGAAHQAGGPRGGGDPRCLRGEDQAGEDLPSQLLQMPFLNPQNGPIMVEGAEKGDVLAVLHRIHGAARRQSARHLLHDPGVRRAHRHLLTATLNDPLPEDRAQDRLDEEWRPLEQARDAALQAAHRDAQLLARDRLDQLADARQSTAATWTCRTWVPAASPTCRCAPPARGCSSATPTPARATARSAAPRSNTRRRPRSAST